MEESLDKIVPTLWSTCIYIAAEPWYQSLTEGILHTTHIYCSKPLPA